MKILSAEFVVSAASVRQFPTSYIPEVAFVGKSNVGKSSLINSLLQRKQMVKTSSTPGKTQLINFFHINGKFHLVDLPGYGFARTPEHVRAGWRALIESYLFQRPALRGVVLILDLRHTPGDLDRRMHHMLDDAGLPCLAIGNKADKLTRSKVSTHLRAVQEALALEEPPLAYSARTHQGRPELWSRLSGLLDSPSRHERGLGGETDGETS